MMEVGKAYTPVLHRDVPGRRGCAESRLSSQPADPIGTGVSLSEIDLKVGRSAKRRTRRCLRPERSIEAGRTRAETKAERRLEEIMRPVIRVGSARWPISRHPRRA